jgi:hypothetical protein
MIKTRLRKQVAAHVHLSNYQLSLAKETIQKRASSEKCLVKHDHLIDITAKLFDQFFSCKQFHWIFILKLEKSHKTLVLFTLSTTYLSFAYFAIIVGTSVIIHLVDLAL